MKNIPHYNSYEVSNLGNVRSKRKSMEKAKKMTAVGWLVKELEAMVDYSGEFINIEVSKDYFNELIKQAKGVQRQEIIDAYEAGVWDVGCRDVDAEVYYNENYNLE